MNPNLEACRKCPAIDDCPLDNKAEQVLVEYQNGDIDQSDVKTRIGRVSQIGNQNNCPKREIDRVRRELFKEMAPGQYNPHARISIKPAQNSTYYESGNYDTLDNGGPVRRR